MTTIYNHPDGHQINIAEGMLTVINDADKAVSIPIGQHGLRELGEALIALSECNYATPDHAEQAGAQVAIDCLHGMGQAGTQAESLRVLEAALSRLERLPHRKQASKGFAVGLVNVLEIGLENLPKGGKQ